MPLVPELLIAARDYAAIEDVFVGQEMGVKRQGDSPQMVHHVSRIQQNFSDALHPAAPYSGD